MDPRALVWVMCEMRPAHLCKDSTEQITEELKAWIVKRKEHRKGEMNMHWSLVRGMGRMRRLLNQSQGLQAEATVELRNNGHSLMAKYIKARDHRQVGCSLLV